MATNCVHSWTPNAHRGGWICTECHRTRMTPDFRPATNHPVDGYNGGDAEARIDDLEEELTTAQQRTATLENDLRHARLWANHHHLELTQNRMAGLPSGEWPIASDGWVPGEQWGADLT